ncbi:GNAT family N-acetyltransferase [Leucobacter coleopterorum]|uniref:GNAT family N-acetyltransferase n=1 Tax=Leucobacter coleopterorum TaxID=2714933 RepID=A0ABX6JZZ9_9MICO|nr:GNAT family N-acetyltransferase [Leucobacter coleopterorum]QIM19178.1 GNAT family N-acetyltransferase [Leucobacter coleopterorum]
MQTNERIESAIRQGSIPDDIEVCVEIWVNALQARDGAVDAESMAQRVRSSFERPIVRFAITDAPHRGFALVESGLADPAEAFLHYLAVDPATTKRGLGRALLADAIEHTGRRGFRSLMLEVRANNTRAIELYTRAGFVPFGEPVPHPLAGYPMQAYRLTLQ